MAVEAFPNHCGLKFRKEEVEWEDFERYAAKVVALLAARKTAVAPGPEMCIWDLAVDGAELALVWNDYPAMTSIESASSEGDALLSLLFSQLKELQPNR